MLAGSSAATGILGLSDPEADPTRESIRVQLAMLAPVLLPATLANFVPNAVKLLPQLRGEDPRIIADVARSMGLTFTEEN